MSESKKYTINTVEDFLLIPENKLEKCLDEFKIAMVASLHMRNLYESVDKSMHGQQTSKLKIGPFIWSDDEEKKLTLNFKLPEESSTPMPGRSE